MAVLQQTLTGDEADDERPSRGTMVYCEECDDYVLRSEKYTHEHNLWNPESIPKTHTTDDEEIGEEDDDEPEELGKVYDITLEYNVTFRFRVPAWSEHEAEERAKDLKLDAKPVDSYHLHTDTRAVKTVMSDDEKVPDDFDPYGGERLWEVYGNDD